MDEPNIKDLPGPEREEILKLMRLIREDIYFGHVDEFQRHSTLLIDALRDAKNKLT